MKNADPLSALDDLVAQYQRKLQHLQSLRELAGDDPELTREILSRVASGLNGQPTKRQQAAGVTHLAQIQQLFEREGNRWMTAPEIIEKTGLSRGAVGNVLYHAKPDAFEKRDHPRRQRMKLWRLKEGGEE